MGPVPTWTAGAHTGQVGQRLTSSECPLGLSSSGRFHHCASEKDPSPASLWPPPCWGSASSLQPPLDPAAPARPHRPCPTHASPAPFFESYLWMDRTF